MNDEIIAKLRTAQIEILDEIVRICGKYGLRYCLTGGTCLGAVRHKGFIPWDDDVDIIMPRSDFNRFIEICPEEENDKFFLDYFTTNPDYGRAFAKYCKKNTLFIEPNGRNQSIYVDIFIQDKVPGPDYMRKSAYLKAIHFCDVMTILRMEGLDGRDWKTKILYWLVRLIPNKTLYHLEIKWMSRFENTDASYYINYSSPYNLIKETIPIAEFEPYAQLPFEGKEYNVPRNYDLYLSNIYGDYMQLPPENKRVTHFPKCICFDTRKEGL